MSGQTASYEDTLLYPVDCEQVFANLILHKKQKKLYPSKIKLYSFSDETDRKITA